MTVPTFASTTTVPAGSVQAKDRHGNPVSKGSKVRLDSLNSWKTGTADWNPKWGEIGDIGTVSQVIHVADGSALFGIQENTFAWLSGDVSVQEEKEA